MPSFSRNSKSMCMSSFFVGSVTFPVGILLLLLLYWHFVKKIHTNWYFYPPIHRKRHNGSIQTYALFVLQQITLITVQLALISLMNFLSGMICTRWVFFSFCLNSGTFLRNQIIDACLIFL